MFRRVIAVPAVLSLAAALLAGVSFAPAAQALDCGQNAHATASGTCEPNSTGATQTQTQVPTNTQPTTQMMSCWNGTQVPMGSACPVAPATGTQTQTQTQTQFTTCPGGTQVPLGSSCPNTQTATQFTTCWNGTQVPIGTACPAAPTASTQTATQFTTCWNGSQVPLGSSCPLPLLELQFDLLGMHLPAQQLVVRLLRSTRFNLERLALRLQIPRCNQSEQPPRLC